MKALLTALALLAALSAAEAQNVYRCGAQYSQEPCKDGKAVNVQDARTPEQQQQAREAAAAEKERARQLAKERQASETAQRPATASGITHKTAPAVGEAKPKAAPTPKPKQQKKQKVKKPLKPARDTTA